MTDVFVQWNGEPAGPQHPAEWLADWTASDASASSPFRRTFYAPPRSGPPESVVVETGWHHPRAASALAACNQAFAEAASSGRPLLVLLQPLQATAAAVTVLRQALDLDPMFGFAVPRIGSHDGRSIATMPAEGLFESRWVPRRLLAELAEHEIVIEHRCSCVLIRPDVLADVGPLDTGFECVDAALVHYMARARRCGFRVVLSNRSVVEAGARPPRSGCGSPNGPLEADRARLARLEPDRGQIWRESRGGSVERFDLVAGTALAERERCATPSLLLDLRNLGAVHNGTTHAALGIARALHRLYRSGDIEVLATEAGSRFHALSNAFPGWPVHKELPGRVFTTALRLSQPWHIQEMVDLHQRALFSAFLFLDTIAWDIQYLGPRHIEGVWCFLADSADGFFFISDFTRRRFHTRFAAARETPSAVCHLSMEASDYVGEEPVTTSSGRHLLVIGNDLDHKDVARTVDLLSTAFPFQPIAVLGSSAPSTAFVMRYRSGSLTDKQVHQLYAGARAVVYPSFYEGFGFPIVTALGYGLTVLVRRSALVDEIASHCRPRGTLVPYGRRDELVGLVGALLHGETLAGQALGRAFEADRPKSWDQIGRDVHTFLTALAAEPTGRQWWRREHAIQQLLAYRD